MYARKIQIKNYGPVDSLDIAFSFHDGEKPKPIVFVGQNGSGKSILLSHIVNPLMVMQQLIYDGTPEVDVGKAYKLRHPLYITSGKQYSFGRVGFQNDLYYEELCLNQSKKNFAQDYAGLLQNNDTNEIWKEMHDNDYSRTRSNISDPGKKEIMKDAFNENCVLYFPPNRFEEPAWLNQKNLRSKAEYMDRKRLQGYTDRKIINYSPLHVNQNWLFEVAYDSRVLPDTHANSIYNNNSGLPCLPQVFLDTHANSIYNISLEVARKIFRSDQNLRFGIGRRQNRQISLILDEKTVVPNIFQFSTGETCLLNLFLSILKDFDLAGMQFDHPNHIRGIVIVDEIDLHLHAIHQHEVLPQLIKMFPRVQFIVTTHSPLFVLGMENTFGPDGFTLYRLPQGQQISSEEFNEFGQAYEFFVETKKFSDHIEQKIKDAQKPLVFMEGKTDIKYLKKAAELLDREETLEKTNIMDGGGFGNLDKIWRNLTCNPRLADKSIPQRIILLYDCEKQRDGREGNIFKSNITRKEGHRLEKGIENLFEETTLKRALGKSTKFIDITLEHSKTERGEDIPIPEKWEVNRDEKNNLCNWLCENGTKGDFRHFEQVFDLLEELLQDS